MDRTAERLLGRAWTDPFPERFLADLTDIDDRMGGHPGEREAADLVADAFEGATGNAVKRPFDIRRWNRGTTELAAGPREGELRTFEAVALPYSPAADLRAPLVDCGYGTPDELDERDVSGRVVVAEQGGGGERHAHRMEKFGHAAAAGAEAFVLVNDTAGSLPVTGTLRFGEEAAIPGIGVSKETGDRLRRYARDAGDGDSEADRSPRERPKGVNEDRAGASLRLREASERAGGEAALRIDAGTDDARSRNVLTWLGPGTDDAPFEAGEEPDGFVLLVAHYDAHDVGEGALDNGCGVAIAVETVRLLADADAELGSPVCVAAVSCEETGLMGSEALAESLDTGRVRAVVNVDGAGRARNLRVYTHSSSAIADRAARVLDGAEQPYGVEDRPHPYSDHWPFLRAGVPSLQLHSEPADDRVPWGPRGRPVVHTRADTLDKVEPRDVREHAGLTALLVRDLASGDAPPRLDSADLAAALREADAERGMRAAGVWPDGW